MWRRSLALSLATTLAACSATLDFDHLDDQLAAGATSGGAAGSAAGGSAPAVELVWTFTAATDDAVCGLTIDDDGVWWTTYHELFHVALQPVFDGSIAPNDLGLAVVDARPWGLVHVRDRHRLFYLDQHGRLCAVDDTGSGDGCQTPIFDPETDLSSTRAQSVALVTGAGSPAAEHIVFPTIHGDGLLLVPADATAGATPLALADVGGANVDSLVTGVTGGQPIVVWAENANVSSLTLSSKMAPAPATAVKRTDIHSSVLRVALGTKQNLAFLADGTAYQLGVPYDDGATPASLLTGLQQPTDLTMSSDGSTLFVVDQAFGSIVAIATSETKTTTLPASGAPEPGSAARRIVSGQSGIYGVRYHDGYVYWFTGDGAATWAIRRIKVDA